MTDRIQADLYDLGMGGKDRLGMGAMGLVDTGDLSDWIRVLHDIEQRMEVGEIGDKELRAL